MANDNSTPLENDNNTSMVNTPLENDDNNTLMFDTALVNDSNVFMVDSASSDGRTSIVKRVELLEAQVVQLSSLVNALRTTLDELKK